MGYIVVMAFLLVASYAEGEVPGSCPGSVVKPGSEPGLLVGPLDLLLRLLLVLFALYGLWRLADDVWRWCCGRRTMQTQSPVTYTSLQNVVNVKFKPLSEWEQGAWEIA